MNKFKKYCPNVWVAECNKEYERGEIIEVETKYGNEIECEVYNLLGQSGNGEETKYLYSIVRLDEGYASKKAEKYKNAALNNEAKKQDKWKLADKDRDFLSLGEPVKIGHHSEKRHRAIIEQRDNNIKKGLEHDEKAREQKRKADYWEKKASEITLAKPESLEYFKYKLEKATEYHKKLKENPELREYPLQLSYAKKEVNELKKKLAIAKELWGEIDEI